MGKQAFEEEEPWLENHPKGHDVQLLEVVMFEKVPPGHNEQEEDPTFEE